MICRRNSATFSAESRCDCIPQMYKVFFNDKSILLTDSYDLGQLQEHTLYVQYDDFEEIHYLIDLLENSKKIEQLVIQYADIEVLWADFRAHYLELDAGGGVVTNGDKKLLLIHRNGKWDLPKGKIEDGESVEDGAIREVKEECGLTDVKLDAHLLDTYHTYYQNGYRMLKRTYWFKMSSADKLLTPQADEGIDKALWIETHDLSDYPSYASIELVYSYINQTTSQP